MTPSEARIFKYSEYSEAIIFKGQHQWHGWLHQRREYSPQRWRLRPGLFSHGTLLRCSLPDNIKMSVCVIFRNSKNEPGLDINPFCEHHNFLQLTVNSPPARSFSFPALSLAKQRRIIDDCVDPWEERSFPQNTANIGQHRLTMTMTATTILRLSNLADEMPGKNFSDCGIVT